MSQFNEGDCVRLTRERDGMIRYKGPLLGKSGVFFGIELHTGKGKNDGIVEGEQYFKVDTPGQGIFVKEKSILYRIDPIDGMSPNPPKDVKRKTRRKQFADKKRKQQQQADRERAERTRRLKQQQQEEKERKQQELLREENERRIARERELEERRRLKQIEREEKLEKARRELEKAQQQQQQQQQQQKAKNSAEQEYLIDLSVNFKLNDDMDQSTLNNACEGELPAELAQLFEIPTDHVKKCSGHVRNNRFNLNFALQINSQYGPHEYLEKFNEFCENQSMVQMVQTQLNLQETPHLALYEARYQKM